MNRGFSIMKLFININFTLNLLFQLQFYDRMYVLLSISFYGKIKSISIQISFYDKMKSAFISIAKGVFNCQKTVIQKLHPKLLLFHSYV